MVKKSSAKSKTSRRARQDKKPPLRKCASLPDSERALVRKAYIVRRLADNLSVSKELLERLDSKDRKALTPLLRTKAKNWPQRQEAYLNSLPQAERDALARLLVAVDPTKDPDAVATASDLIASLPEIHWLWPGWIPFGMVTLIVAPPGMGKSMLALLGIVHPILDGSKWPDGQPGPRYKNAMVVWCDTESSQAITAKRITDAKLQADRILMPGSDALASVNLQAPSAVDELRELVRIHKPCIIVIDSLRGSHKADENTSQIAALLEPLAQLARDTNVAIVVIHHTKKVGEGEVNAESARGSNAIIAMCRSVLAVDKPDRESDWKRLRVVKSNIAVHPEPIGFFIHGDRLEYGPAPKAPTPERVGDDAERFLREALAGGPVESQRLAEEAVEAGVSVRTLRRAKKTLGVVASKRRDTWVWSLPRKEGGQ